MKRILVFFNQLFADSRVSTVTKKRIIFLMHMQTYQKIPSFPLVPFDSTLIAPFLQNIQN
jgi:hypothetical protein